MIKKILKRISKDNFSIKLSPENLKRLENYCKSVKIKNKSDHWDKRNNLDLLSFENDRVILSNKPSGFDNFYKLKFTKLNPYEKYWNFIGLFKKFISNFVGNYYGLGFCGIRHFDKHWPKNKSFFYSGNMFDKKNYIYNIKKYSPFWYFNEIYNIIKDRDNLNYLEIGPGSGDLITIIKNHSKVKQIYSIDLPQNIPFCFLNIITNFPNSTYLLPNEINNEYQKIDAEFVFLDTENTKLLPNNFFDIAVNTASLGEMNHEEIKKYFTCLRDCLKKNNVFLNINRVEKKIINDSNLEYLRFSEYPWNKNDKDFMYEISNINVGRNMNNAFIKVTNLYTEN